MMRDDAVRRPRRRTDVSLGQPCTWRESRREGSDRYRGRLRSRLESDRAGEFQPRAVRAENVVHGSDQQGCYPSGPAR
jgi:hypothetical protein